MNRCGPLNSLTVGPNLLTLGAQQVVPDLPVVVGVGGRGWGGGGRDWESSVWCEMTVVTRSGGVMNTWRTAERHADSLSRRRFKPLPGVQLLSQVKGHVASRVEDRGG